MKIKSLLLFLLIIGRIATYGIDNNTVTIKGKVVGFVPSRLQYVNPINGFSFPGFRDSIIYNVDGTFLLRFPIEQSSIITIYASSNTGLIIAEPGESYSVSFELKDGKTLFNISGPNEAGQKLYNELPSPYMVQFEFRRIGESENFSLYSEKVKEEKDKQIKKFKDLLNRGLISESFFNKVMIDRNCYFSTLLSTFPFVKYTKVDILRNEKFPEELKKQWGKVFEDNPPTDPKNLFSPRWFEYAKYYVEFKQYLSDTSDLKSLEKSLRKGLRYTEEIALSEKLFSKKVAETYAASLIYERCLQKKFEKEWIAIFERFNVKYPQSMAIPYLIPMVNPVAEYQKLAKTNFSNQVKFIDNADEINTLEECMAKLKGKKIYVDVWATWCGPCKVEFKYKDSLDILMKSKGFEVLYISIDKQDKEEQWKEMIKFYKLDGHHIRAHKEFQDDLIRIFNKNGTIAIPWYLLIDEQGKIINKDAARPSEIETLEKQIKMVKN